MRRWVLHNILLRKNKFIKKASSIIPILNMIIYENSGIIYMKNGEDPALHIEITDHLVPFKCFGIFPVYFTVSLILI